MPTLHKPASQLALYLRFLVYPQTELVDEPGSALVWYSHMRGCTSVRLVPLMNRRPEEWRHCYGQMDVKFVQQTFVGTEDKRQHGGDMQLRCCDHGLLT